MMTDQVMKIHAIVVTYNPELDVLIREFELVIPQVDKIWVIDNASSSSLATWVDDLGLHDKLELVQMPANLGLGAAQNAGIQLARAAGATHVLILDQDSQPMPDMVDRLLAASNQLQSAGVPVAAVAPVYADSATGPASGFVRLGWLDFKKQTVLPGQDVVEADFVISSGSLIPVSVLDDIGPMDRACLLTMWTPSGVCVRSPRGTSCLACQGHAWCTRWATGARASGFCAGAMCPTTRRFVITTSCATAC